MGFLDVHAQAVFAADKMKKVGLGATEHLFCDLYCLEPGQSQKIHAHAEATKVYLVLSGSVSATVGAEIRDLGPGELAFCEPGRPHGIDNRSGERAEVLVVMAPNPNR
jgi:quercetin dioxygenase-like cupin family protein